MGLGKGPPSAAGDAREETRKDAFLIIDSLCGVVLLISGACIAAQPPEVCLKMLFAFAFANITYKNAHNQTATASLIIGSIDHLASGFKISSDTPLIRLAAIACSWYAGMGVTTCNFIMAGQSIDLEGKDKAGAPVIEYVDNGV
jgi:hypothetical protein